MMMIYIFYKKPTVLIFCESTYNHLDNIVAILIEIFGQKYPDN